MISENGLYLLESDMSNEGFLGIDVSQLPKDPAKFTCIPIEPSLWKTKAQWDSEDGKAIAQTVKPSTSGKMLSMDELQKILFEDVKEKIESYNRAGVAIYERNAEMSVLHLSLKQIWYDLISSGEKLEEYRLINGYWVKRLVEKVYSAINRVPMVFVKPYTHVELSLGYPKADDWSRRMLFEIESISIGRGNTNWGAPADEDVFKIKLGKRIK